MRHTLVHRDSTSVHGTRHRIAVTSGGIQVPMAWDEWERMKADAAQRRSAGMRIDHLADMDGGSSGGSGGSGPDLKASKGPWTKASGAAHELRASTDSGITDLKTAHEEVKGGTDGFTSAAALNEILPTWEKRLTSVRDECDRLNGALARTGRDFGEVDPAVANRIGNAPTGGKPGWDR
ncbi:amino acid ABC transporter permease [Streptomyces seoulensis]